MTSLPPASPTPLNILWISLEDCSPRLGCYGDSLAQTPNLDALAREGRLYEKAFCTAPVCAPARSAIITGMYAASVGAQHMRVKHNSPASHGRLPNYECVPPPFVKLLPEYLRAVGYFCSNNEKTDYQFRPPFTAWDAQGKDAHWRQRAQGQSFFAVFNNLVTHESGMWESHRAGSIVLHERREPETNPAAVSVPSYLPDTLEIRKTIARQYDNLHRADVWAGSLLRELEEDGLAENTVVFVWSDHGEGLPRHKRWLYDSGLRVPLLVRWPGRIAAGSVSRRLVSTIDLAPTVLRLAEVPVPAHFQGVDFLDSQATERRQVFATRDRYDEFYDCQRAVRDERFKYIRTYHPELPEMLWCEYFNKHPATRELWRLRREGTLPESAKLFFRHPRPPEELYDTVADPEERQNLASDPDSTGKLTELRAALESWQAEIGDLFREDEAAMVRRFWPDGNQPRTAPPVLLAYDPERCGFVVEEEVRLAAPAMVQLHPPTQGASVGYRYADDPATRWRLYSGPIALPPGQYEIQAKAIRIGYGESPEAHFRISVG